MNAAGGAISVLVGTVLLRLTLTGAYQRYVRVGMAPFLVAAGVAVLGLGLVTLVRAMRARRRPGAAGHRGAVDAHGHGDDDRVGWLLLAPIAALLLVAPPALGSYGVDRAASVDVRTGAPEFAPLAPGAGPVPMTLLEFSQRAFDHDGASFNGVAVQLTGFVAGPDGDGPVAGEGGDRPFRLARYQIACCAVDAAPVMVRVVGAIGATPARDRWVTVTGAFEPAGEGDSALPAITATTIVEIEPPTDPYE